MAFWPFGKKSQEETEAYGFSSPDKTGSPISAPAFEGKLNRWSSDLPLPSVNPAPVSDLTPPTDVKETLFTALPDIDLTVFEPPYRQSLEETDCEGQESLTDLSGPHILTAELPPDQDLISETSLFILNAPGDESSLSTVAAESFDESPTGSFAWTHTDMDAPYEETPSWNDLTSAYSEKKQPLGSGDEPEQNVHSEETPCFSSPWEIPAQQEAESVTVEGIILADCSDFENADTFPVTQESSGNRWSPNRLNQLQLDDLNYDACLTLEMKVFSSTLLQQNARKTNQQLNNLVNRYFETSIV